MSQRLITLLAKPSREDLAALADLMATGKLIPVIDKRYSLSEVPEAIAYLKEGHARGKVLIMLGGEYGCVSQQKLDLFDFSAVYMAELRAGSEGRAERDGPAASVEHNAEPRTI